MTLRFPYSRQDVSAEDVAVVTQALSADYLTQGPLVEAFEQALARYLGCREVVACSNGTAALHLAYLAAELGPRRGLMTSPVTFLATGNAARMLDAPVAFADVDPATGNLDPDAVRTALRRSEFPIAALCVVHLAGRAIDMAPFQRIAEEFGLILIEDASHALGADYPGDANRGVRVGGGGHARLSTFSFHAIKHVTTGGEGGAICTDDTAMAQRMRRLRSHGMRRDPADAMSDDPERGPWSYAMDEIGFNYRLTDVQCALGISQLARLDESLRRRRHLAGRYLDAFAGANTLTPPPRPQPGTAHAWHLFPVAIDFARLGLTRGQLMRGLAEDGIGAQVHYIPLYRQPYYARLGAQPLPGAETYYARTLSLPMYPQLGDDDVAEIAQHLLARLSK